MCRIAVVEDSAFDQKKLLAGLARYEKETGVTFEILTFSDGEELIHNYPEHLDILLMDIMMEKMDGMQAARLIRRRNDQVLLIFVTSIAQYAIQGYSVNAMDFILKPVSYTGLKVRLDRAMLRLKQRETRFLAVHTADGSRQLDVSRICYVETSRHKLLVHTMEAVFPVNRSMRSLEKELSGLPFFRCHTSFLINLNYVDKVRGNDIWVNGRHLFISRYRRKEFLELWSVFLGE